MAMCDQDFSFDEENPRLTRVIFPSNAVARTFDNGAALTVDEIEDGLQSLSMVDDSSDSEDDILKDFHNEPIAVQKEDIKNQPDKTTNAKKDKKSKVAIVKPNNNTKNNEKIPNDKIKQNKSRARKQKKPLASDEEDCLSACEKQTSHSPDLIGESSSVFNQVKALPSSEFHAFIKSVVKDDQVSVNSDESFESENDHAETVVETKPAHAQTKTVTKGTAKTNMGKLETLGKDQAECHAFIKSVVKDDQVCVNSDESFESENDHAETVVETKPAHAQTKKVTKGTAKTKMGKLETLGKEQDNINENFDKNHKKTIRGKKATAIVAPNTSEQTDKEETIAKNDRKTKNSRKVAAGKEGEPEKETTEVMPVEIKQTKNKKPVEKVVPSNSNSNKVKKGKQPEGQTNKESGNDETSSDSKLYNKHSKNRRLAHPNDSNDIKEKKTTVKETVKYKNYLEKNDVETNEQTVGDNIVVSPPPAKGRQTNLRKVVNKLKEKQPLKELNTAQVVKPAPKTRNRKNCLQGSDVQIENDTTNIPESKSAPKKRNMANVPKVDCVEMESEENIHVPMPKEVRSNAKQNLNDKGKKDTSKPRKGANKEKEIAPAPEETAPRRTTRNRK